MQQMLDDRLIQPCDAASSSAAKSGPLVMRDDVSQFVFVKERDEEEVVKQPKLKKGDVKLLDIAPAELARQVTLLFLSFSLSLFLAFSLSLSLSLFLSFS